MSSASILVLLCKLVDSEFAIETNSETRDTEKLNWDEVIKVPSL